MRIFSLAACVLVIASSAYAQNVDAPFFAAFKGFCIDTGARPMAVKTAVEAAGGKQSDPTGSASVPATVTIWEITIDGRKMAVLSGTVRAPIAPRQLGDMIACSISSPVSEDASIAAVRDWVGVPPAPPLPNTPWVTTYSFQQDGSVRTPITDNGAERAALARGAEWQLMLMQLPNLTTVQLMNIVPSAPSNQAP